MSESEYSGVLRVGRVPGYPSYRVLSNGSVWSRQGGNWLRKRAFRDRYGYFQLNLSADGRKGRFSLHEVVLMAFIGPRPEGWECRHLDGDKANNRLENLQWGTSKENAADAKRHGTRLVGSRQTQAKLTEADVLEIRRRAKEGRGGVQGELAVEYGVSDTIISHIVTRKAWGHVS